MDGNQSQQLKRRVDQRCFVRVGRALRRRIRIRGLYVDGSDRGPVGLDRNSRTHRFQQQHRRPHRGDLLPILCVAADFDGSILYSTDPTGGTSEWHSVPIDVGLEFTGISCPSISLCFAVTSGGQVVTSTNPTGAASAWKTTANLSASLAQISCASPTLCAAIDTAGDIVSTTAPKSSASAWTKTHVDDATLQAISCTSVGSALCVASDSSGNVLTSVDPTGGPTAWTATGIHSSAAIPAISCPSATLCVAGGATDGDVLSATNPTGGANAWTAIPADTFLVSETNVPTSLLSVDEPLCRR